MFDFLRARLSKEEQDAFDSHDGWAAFSCHFVMWPAILATAFYFSGLVNTALIFFVVAAAALPIMLWHAKQARAVRGLAEERYNAIMQIEETERDRQGNTS